VHGLPSFAGIMIYVGRVVKAWRVALQHHSTWLTFWALKRALLRFKIITTMIALPFPYLEECRETAV
jgi:hypothetical protein